MRSSVTDLLRKIVRRLKTAHRKPRSWMKVRSQSGRLLTASRTDASSLTDVREAISVLMTFKVSNDDRGSILSVVSDRLRKDLGGADIPILIGDASPDRYAGPARNVLSLVSSDVDYRRHNRPMTLSYLDLLDACSTPYCYLQFEDQIMTNLSPGFLLAGCKLLKKYAGIVPAVTAVWPLKVAVDESRREIQVLVHRRRRSAIRRREQYEFGEARRQRPLLIEEIDGYRFGIFRNFYYGFSFFHIITRADDYARRLRWYIDRVGSSSAHEIELAASDRTLGPFWTHFAVCLDDVAVLDVDYSHTNESVRPEASTAREVHRALAAGFDIRAFHSDVE